MKLSARALQEKERELSFRGIQCTRINIKKSDSMFDMLRNL
jgi:hypothetical protein